MTDAPVVVVTEFMDEQAVERLKAAVPTHYDPGLVDNPQHLEQVVAGARALIVRNRTQVRGSLLQAARALEIVGRLGVGLDNIDVPACQARSIQVKPATGANAASVAEYVIATMLHLIRGRAYSVFDEITAGTWPRGQCVGGEVGGRTLGLVGFGGIAREVARRARALDMSVIAYDPMIPADASVWSEGSWAPVKPVSLEILYGEADVISLHVPLTNQTRNMIDQKAIAGMKDTALVINTARGGIVDETALLKALRANKLGGAAVDVFATEPVDQEAGSRFIDVPNLVLTPHIAGVTNESNERVSDMIASKVLKHLLEA